MLDVPYGRVVVDLVVCGRQLMHAMWYIAPSVPLKNNVMSFPGGRRRRAQRAGFANICVENKKQKNLFDFYGVKIILL